MSIYAVNGKEPTVAWVPSHSLSANDLVGSSHLTLFGGASIVANSDAGGSHAFLLDGIDGYLRSAPIDLGSAYSISVWVNTSDTDSCLIADRGNKVGHQINLLRSVSNFSTWIASTNRTTGGWLNAWMHLIAVFESGTLTIYRDGVFLAGLSFPTTPLFDPTKNLTLGAQLVGGTTPATFLGGLIDDIRLWSNVALDATDAASLFAAQRGGDASGEATGNPTTNLLNSTRQLRHAL